jgi:hypothetical protein
LIEFPHVKCNENLPAVLRLFYACRQVDIRPVCRVSNACKKGMQIISAG